MYLLDTNVISELRRPSRTHKAVLAWAATLSLDQTYLSAITVFEIESGIRKKERSDPPQGAILREWFAGQVLAEYADRILELDARAALVAARYEIDNGIPAADAMIAAIAQTNGLTLVTRNVRHFAVPDVAHLNPWEHPAGEQTA